jgi:hypothetical protein
MRDGVCGIASPCTNNMTDSLNIFLASVFDCETGLVGHAVFVYILYMELTCVSTGQREVPHAWQ